MPNARHCHGGGIDKDDRAEKRERTREAREARREAAWQEREAARVVRESNSDAQASPVVVQQPPTPAPLSAEEIEKRRQEHEQQMQELRAREAEAQLALARQQEAQAMDILLATKRYQEQERVRKEMQRQREVFQSRIAPYNRRIAMGRSTMIFGGAAGATLALFGAYRYIMIDESSSGGIQSDADRDYNPRQVQNFAIMVTGATVAITSVVVGAIVRRTGIAGKHRVQAEMQRLGVSFNFDSLVVYGRI